MRLRSLTKHIREQMVRKLLCNLSVLKSPHLSHWLMSAKGMKFDFG